MFKSDYRYVYESNKSGNNKKNENRLKGRILPFSDRTLEHLKSAYAFSKNDTAQLRLKIIEFSNKCGVKAAVDAFNVSRATIYRWKKRSKDSNGRLDSLIPKSRRSKRLRKMIIDPEIVSFIRNIRKEHPRIGKEKIKPLLDEYCNKRNIKTISVSTIGKIIKRYCLELPSSSLNYHNPKSKWAKRKTVRGRYKKKVKCSPKSNQSGYVEIDTIVKFVNGIKRYVYNAVDINTRLEFSYAFKSKNSRNTVKFFKKLEEIYPERNGIITVQTDNGSEYIGEFDKYLKSKGIKHLFTYPRCPKINGYVERANRTLEEEFLNYHLYLLSDNIKEFNSKLMDYLIWYNTKRSHKGINNLSPIDFLLKYNLESQMYITYTTC